MLSRLELRHFHPCSVKKSINYHEYRELTMHAKCVIKDNDETRIQPNKTYLAMANEMKEINPNFFYTIDVDEGYQFRSALLVDARHGQPFAFFIGVNHHKKSTLFGCVLLGNEKIPNFEWVFKKWVKCMKIAPQEIITDRCKAMFGAFRKVLPNMLLMLHLAHNEVDAAKAYLYDNRRMWVPILFQAIFALVYGVRKGVKIYTYRGKSSLVQFVREYDNVLKNKEQKELKYDVTDSKGVPYDVVNFWEDNDVEAIGNKDFDAAVRWNESQEYGKFMSLLNSFGNS
ncbi:hypothetical protein Ahy_B02g060686 [Arachis hypogaea]|uniref:MULE transposase domain-containing protein n=1 Tax=Arachis hypogaea TaxID=3818 RepID=A0A445AJ58_ARAHY|nr:hypothetical protein Ahy_B02g060686 [Arachis hypogaea]